MGHLNDVSLDNDGEGTTGDDEDGKCARGNDNGNGATGDKFDDDGKRATGDDVDAMVTVRRVTVCDNEDNGDGRGQATKLTMMATAQQATKSTTMANVDGRRSRQ